MSHKLAITIAIVAGLTTLTLGAYYRGTHGGGAPVVTAELVSRGAVVSTVAATGTLQAVTTVLVGTQVSGAIEALYADFNSIVRKGQVLARLEPSLYRSAIDQARANLVRAEADRDRLQVSVEDARARLARARELSERQLIPAVEVDAAELAVRTGDAQVRSAEAQVTQARAAVSQTTVNLDKTVITSPIDGIVIARNVDVGQTVAASLQAPTLFEIAADLTEMQLKASIDEADLGRIVEGQAVRFTVDAYPNDTFTGRVEQVRLSPAVEQNVVTYAAIISAPNPALKLKPGMTANLTIEVARRDGVLRVPNAALRFRPSDELLTALDGVRPESAPVREGSATVWQQVDDSVRAIVIRTGVFDATHTELMDESLEEGALLVTRAAIPASGSAQPSAASPLMPSAPPRR